MVRDQHEGQIRVFMVDAFGNHPHIGHVSRIEEYDGGTDGVVLYDGTKQAWRVTSHLEPGAKEQIRRYVDVFPHEFGWGDEQE